MCDEVGQASEQAAAQFTLEDGVHLLQQHVLQLAGACKPNKSSDDYFHWVQGEHVLTEDCKMSSSFNSICPYGSIQRFVGYLIHIWTQNSSMYFMLCCWRTILWPCLRTVPASGSLKCWRSFGRHAKLNMARSKRVVIKRKSSRFKIAMFWFAYFDSSCITQELELVELIVCCCVKLLSV